MIVVSINILKMLRYRNVVEPVAEIKIYQGTQSKYYVIDGIKYHSNFPVGWAINHDHITGPKECGNCFQYGSIGGIFVGYCGNCLREYNEKNQWRGNLIEPGMHIECMDCDEFWQRCPYMTGIQIDEIGERNIRFGNIVKQKAYCSSCGDTVCDCY